MKMSMLTAAAVLAMAGGAMAQTANPAQPAAPNAASQPAPDQTNFSQQMKTTLQQAGFTEVRIVPDSFLVQAKDRAGNPVMMSIGPDSVTEVVGEPAEGSSRTTGKGGSGPFTSVPSSDMLSSAIIGLDVDNPSNQDLGKIKDIAYQGSRVQAYIVDVHGSAGTGDRSVAVDPAALHVSWNGSDHKLHATLNATADQLKAAPEFKSPTRS